MNNTAGSPTSFASFFCHPERSTAGAQSKDLPVVGRHIHLPIGGRKVLRLRYRSAQDDRNFCAAQILLAALVLFTLPNAAAEPGKPSPTPAASANRAPSGPATYDSFRLIHTRNVFDPDRRPIRPPGSGTPAPATVPTQADYAALTGTMVSPEKTYAFFSGSRPEFNKVLSVREKFANATVADITAQSIEIERDGKRTTVLVGQTVPLDNQSVPGEPPADAAPAAADTSSGTVSAPAASPTPANTYRPATGTSSAYRPATATATTAGPRGTPANLEEIRRRMMEKRQQDLK